jgi:cytochrome c oxidase cbb3-type subunit 3
VACHGAGGRGNTDLGAPSLVDDYWQHGDSMMNIRLAITRGTESTCPAQGDVLDATEIELLSAYVRQLSADGAASWVE